MAGKPSLTLKRRLGASPQRVFKAWTTSHALAEWFGPADIRVLKAETDPRVGGKFRVIMQANDGETHDVSGEYREVVANEKLVFTWSWRTTPERQSLVTVLLKGEGDATLLTLTHEQFFDEMARDRHRTGWTGCLDKLERFFEPSR